MPYRKDCYICNDPDFKAMGLPLCYECPVCGGHVAADAVICDDCNVNVRSFAYAVEIGDPECITFERRERRHGQFVKFTPAPPIVARAFAAYNKAVAALSINHDGSVGIG